MSWWDTAYRSGRVHWDPGEYDGHLPWLLDRYEVDPCRVFDAGCGNGKSAVWLAEQGFEVVGVDMSAPAIEQARSRAESRGVGYGDEAASLTSADSSSHCGNGVHNGQD